MEWAAARHSHWSCHIPQTRNQMHNLSAEKNRRVLIIDDNHAIHDDFRKILSPAKTTGAAMDDTEVALFGLPTLTVRQNLFEVESAYQGQEGVLLVQKA